MPPESGASDWEHMLSQSCLTVTIQILVIKYKRIDTQELGISYKYIQRIWNMLIIYGNYYLKDYLVNLYVIFKKRRENVK